MRRYIDADKLQEAFKELHGGKRSLLIDTEPTADVRENVKGEWIDAEWENINTGEKRKGRRCSACGCGYFRYDVSVNTVSDIPNFCPNCGADMRGDKV